MKIRKRLWALLLSAVLLITYMPAMAFADDTQDAANAVPESAEYVGADLRGVVGTDRILGLEDPSPGGNRFDVTFSDGSVKEFCWPEADDEVDEDLEGAFIYDKNTYLYAEIDEEEGEVSFKEGINSDVKLTLTVHYCEGEEEAVASLPVTTEVHCMYDNKPLGIKFIPAEGFKAECNAGPVMLTEEIFYAPGNCFEVTYEGWDDNYEAYTVYKSRVEYYNFGNDAEGNTIEGFAINGNPERYGSFTLDDGVYCELTRGEETEVEFSYTEYIPEFDDYETVYFTVPVTATKYNPYANWPVYAYTGKVRTPSFMVYDNDDTLIDPSEYDVTYDPEKKMGWYEATITFKDKEKYVDSITGSYGIGPAAPKITKLVAGKKSMTVKWKKLTAAQLKNVDGYYIEMSTDRSFINNYKSVWISKKAIKSGKKLVKNLKKGKRYYVRMYAYKKITQDGESFRMYSNYSKLSYRKTK